MFAPMDRYSILIFTFIQFIYPSIGEFSFGFMMVIKVAFVKTE